MLGSEVRILDKNLANMIAAGEVVERPASVVKELVENSLDAAADEIIIEIKNGGKSYIRVTDNGIGMTMANARKAFLRHATSKIASTDDLFSISTMGFRGEALAAICSVSKVELMTAIADESYGTHLVIEGGDEVLCDEMGLPLGTTIIVRDLFYNTPARYNFMKKDSTETANIISMVQKLALSKDYVSFRLIVDGKVVFKTDFGYKKRDIIYLIYGKDVNDNLLPVTVIKADIVVEGFVCRPRCSRSNRNFQLFYVNGRYVKSKTITAAIDRAYHNSLMTGKHAIAMLFLDIDPSKTDVNVHPTKMEIKFSDEKLVFEAVYRAVKEALDNESTFNNKEMYTSEEIKLADGIIDASNSIPKSYLVENNISKKEIEMSKSDVLLNVRINGNHKLSDKSDYRTFNPAVAEEYEPGILEYSPRVSAKLRESGYCNRQIRLPIEELSLKYCKDRYDDSFIITSDIEYRYVGELFKTYIIIESGNYYYFVDKHAAHERIVFNKIYRQYKEGVKYQQQLLNPIPISLSPEEADVAHRYKDEMAKYGFVFSEFGDNDVLLRTVPYAISMGDATMSFVELIDIFDETGEAGITEYENRTMKMLACKAAIKAGFDSSDEELEHFIKDLIVEGNINYCPHGRPIICEYMKSDIEKAFKRKL